MLRYICCFSKGGACEADNKVSTDHQLDDKKSAQNVAKSAQKGALSPVLVEHFTSQGCKSCPPADLLISQLGQGKSADVPLEVPIIILCFHVEYWDYLGWKDPFASSAWTLRQRNYGQALQQDSIYTPEVIVQGRSHCTASGIEPILDLIHTAPRFPAPDVNATYKLSTDPFILDVSLELVVKSKVDKFPLDVMFALHESGLVTNCEKGENKGRILTNDFVVRRLVKAATIQDWPAKKTFRTQFQVPLWLNFSKTKVGALLFLQNPSSMEVYGCQSLTLPPDELKPWSVADAATQTTPATTADTAES